MKCTTRLAGRAGQRRQDGQSPTVEHTSGSVEQLSGIPRSWGTRSAYPTSHESSAERTSHLPNSQRNGKSFHFFPGDNLPEGVSSIVHGIDSLSFSFHGLPNVREVFERSSLLDTYTGEILPVVQSFRNRWIKDSLSGAYVRLIQPYGPPFVKVEVRRLASLLASQVVGRQLAPVHQLLDGVERARELLLRVGIQAGETVVRLARCDLAADITFDNTIDAQLFLKGLAGMDVPRWQGHVDRRPGSQALQTVRFSMGEGIQLRIYDVTARRLKQRISDPALAGRVIRFERQIRKQGKEQPSVEEFLALDLSALFLDGLSSWNLELLEIGSRERRCRRLQGLLKEGSLTDALLDSTLGALERDCILGDEAWANRGTARRRRRRFRQLGLTAAETEDETFHIGAVLQALVDRWQQPILVAMNGAGPR